MPEPSAAEQTTLRLADRLVAGTLRRRDWHDAAALALALAVPGAWVSVALLGVATLVWAHPIWWLFGWALLAGAVMLRPRPLRIEPAVDFDDARAAVRSPALDAALAGLAAQVGARPPDAVFVTTEPDVSLVRDSLGRRGVLLVGMPLWGLLDDGARRAALAHELSHEAFRDPRRVGAVSLAGRWLAQWATQVGAGVEGNTIGRPAHEHVFLEPLAARTITNVGLHGPTVTRFASNVGNAGVGGLIRRMARLLEKATFVPHQRAELLADAAAVGVAGSSAVLRMLDAVPLQHRVGLSARTALLRTDGVDLRHTVAEHLAALPDHQREGMAVQVAIQEVRTDQAHPPVRVRRDLVHRLDQGPPSLVLDATTWRAAYDDLDAAFAPLERDLRTLARRPAARSSQSRRPRR